MKIALSGFEDFPQWWGALRWAAEEEGSTVVGVNEADIVFVPHHLDAYFPSSRSWVGLWLKGGLLRIMDFKELSNPPGDVFSYETPQKLMDDSATIFARLEQLIQADGEASSGRRKRQKCSTRQA